MINVPRSHKKAFACLYPLQQPTKSTVQCTSRYLVRVQSLHGAREAKDFRRWGFYAPGDPCDFLPRGLWMCVAYADKNLPRARSSPKRLLTFSTAVAPSHPPIPFSPNLPLLIPVGYY